MAARLRATDPSGKPVLLRVDEAAQASREQHDQDLADIYAFLLWQFDAPPPVAPAVPVAPPADVAPPAPVTPSQEGAASPK